MTAGLTGETRETLASVSTATLTTVLLKHGLRNTAIYGVRLVNANPMQMVGEAFTLRYIPAREDIDVLSVFEDYDHPQRKAVETIPSGHVMVVDSRGDAHAASAGAILLSRMMVRGASGFVTDGGLRDTPTIAQLAMPAYCAAPSAPTNLVRHHAVDINVPIGCGGVAVYPGDVIVGDTEAVVVIPAGIAVEVAQEAGAMTRFEDWAEARVRDGRTLRGLYPPDAECLEEFASWEGSDDP